MPDKPNITVAVPTYNRAGLLERCLENLRRQENAAFKVIILDNCSTDETPAVAKRICDADERFRHVRNAENIPTWANFRRGFDLAETEFFLWRADDDFSADNYLAELSQLLKNNPTMELAVPDLHIELEGKVYETPFRFDRSPDDAANAPQYLRLVRSTWIYGMWRRDALFRNYALVGDDYDFLWASDHLLMLPTIIQGRVVHSPDTWFHQTILGTASYTLPPGQLLQARRVYARIAKSLPSELEIPRRRSRDFKKALNYHIDHKVGFFWSNAIKATINQIFGIELQKTGLRAAMRNWKSRPFRR